jgi:hypothetical protein
MTTWNIFPSTNGPASPASLTGSYIAGMMWTPKQSAKWLLGYRAWCCNTGQPTTPVKCALRNSLSPTTGDAALVPNSTATTGTLVPGTWNNALLPIPIPVALNAPYIACAAYNGNFPFTISQFGPAEPFASGITQGPLLAYSDSSLGATVNATPFTLPQGCFTTAFSDPTSPGATPASGNNSFNSWVDVILSDTPPAGFTGPYEGWPNMYNPPPGAALDTNQAFNVAHQFDLSQRCQVGRAKFWSITGAASLPTAVGIWDLNAQQLVAANMAPTWLNALTGAPGAAGGGKMTTVMPAVVLPPGQYAVSVFNSNGAAGAWSPRVYGYFLTGDGANGLSWGPVTIPAQAQAKNAYVFQPNPASNPPYTNGSQQEPSNGRFFFNAFTFPNLAVDFNFSSGAPAGAIAEWFGIDLELTPVPGSGYSLPVMELAL